MTDATADLPAEDASIDAAAAIPRLEAALVDVRTKRAEEEARTARAVGALVAADPLTPGERIAEESTTLAQIIAQERALEAALDQARRDHDEAAAAEKVRVISAAGKELARTLRGEYMDVSAEIERALDVVARGLPRLREIYADALEEARKELQGAGRGFRLTASTSINFRPEQLQKDIELHLASRVEWRRDDLPPIGGARSFTQLRGAAVLSVLADYEVRFAAQTPRAA